MRILLIGNFSSPYDEENLHNLTLLNRLSDEGHECTVLNIAELSKDQVTELQDKRIVNIKNYPDFIIKFIRHGYRCKIIHFLTKGYTRPGLMKLVTSVVFGKFMFKKVIITLHPELFSIFGQLRSKLGGQQLLHLSFSMANKVICGETHTYEVASLHYSAKEKFEVIPSFISIPEETPEIIGSLKKIEDRKKVIVFSGVKYPSYIFDVIINLLTKYLEPDIGIVVSISEKKSQQLKNALEEVDYRFINNIVFVWPADREMLSIAYARADLVVRTLSCDGRPLFDNIALLIKKPLRSGDYLYFPTSLLFIKEGETAELCAYTINKILMEKTEKAFITGEDFYNKIISIYSKGI
jgi:hypothetical protein